MVRKECVILCVRIVHELPQENHGFLKKIRDSVTQRETQR